MIVGGLLVLAHSEASKPVMAYRFTKHGPAIVTWTVSEDVVGSVHHSQIAVVASEYSEHPTL